MMRELSVLEINEVSGGILPIIIAIAANTVVRLVAKTVIATVVGAVVGTSVYNAVKK